MKLNVKLFAVARQLAQAEQLDVDLPDGSTVGDLRDRMALEHPDLAPLLPHVLFAVGSEYVGDDKPLADAMELACIPPVSGG
jgi:molybdopterin converting factor small subunit